MEVNQQEEAARALEVGKKALEANQYEKAIKMLEKSIRMRKTAQAEALLNMAVKAKARVEAKNNPQPVTPGAGSDRPFTEEQERSCKRILASKTYYECLSVESSASEEDIKKAYRKLALKFHPDKCAAPSADEAFKKVSKAFKVLMDPNDRAHYDRFGESEQQGMGGVRTSQHRQHGDFHEMDHDELLRWFMSGGMRGGPFGPGVRVHHNFGRQYGQQQEPEGFTLLRQFIPLIMFLFILMSSMGNMIPSNSGGVGSAQYRSNARASGHIFSLVPDRVHNVKRKTTMQGVVPSIPYFVEPRFATTVGKSPRDLYYVETEVVNELYRSLADKCTSEMNAKNQKIQQARQEQRQDSLGRAYQIETPSCALQKDLESKKRKYK